MHVLAPIKDTRLGLLLLFLLSSLSPPLAPPLAPRLIIRVLCPIVVVVVVTAAVVGKVSAGLLIAVVCSPLHKSVPHRLELLEPGVVASLIRVEFKGHLLVALLNVHLAGLRRQAQEGERRAFLQQGEVAVDLAAPLLDLGGLAAGGLLPGRRHVLVQLVRLHGDLPGEEGHVELPEAPLQVPLVEGASRKLLRAPLHMCLVREGAAVGLKRPNAVRHRHTEAVQVREEWQRQQPHTKDRGPCREVGLGVVDGEA
mmetsp:Transcript_137961/g.384799  ORF Transcript_137961/g.384799 Transcript_137961/m.384799 type:complete len:255 (+) Transcript_137961:963-1727(+)